jgi:glycerophosphoryl diester phosphodiesterase
MGADYLEQDLQMTADDVLVVMHDDTLERTTGGRCRGLVREKTLAMLTGCDAGSWFNERWPDRARPEFADLRIPTLQAVLERYTGSARFYIETKSPRTAPGMEDELVRLIRHHGLLENADDELPTVIVQSFSVASLRKLHALEPRLALVRLFGRHHTAFTLRRLLPRVARYAFGIGPSQADTNERLVRAAHASGLAVHPWTVNDPARMRRFERIGVDGIFTDFPDRVPT